MTLSEPFRLLEESARQRCPAPLQGFGCTLIFSVSDGKQRARVCHASAPSFDEAWQRGEQDIRSLMHAEKLAGEHLRADWVESSSRLAWGEFQRLLSSVKRTYFRFGIAFDEKHRHVLTEMECHANAIFYGSASEARGRFNERNFTAYAAQRFKDAPCLPSLPDDPVWAVTTAGVYLGPDAAVHALPGLLPKSHGLVSRGLYAGHREVPRLDPGLLRSLVGSASRWLARQIQPDGRFIYGYFPCFDRRIAAYNSLRHASSLYALLDVIPFTGDNSLLEPAARGLACLARDMIRVYEPRQGQRAAFLLEEDSKEIKLGGNGVALLAFAKYRELTGSEEYDELLSLLAEGTAFMQTPDSGAFVHVLHSEDLSVKQNFRIIYYDGEAVFGLLRLYAQDKNPRWLCLARKAFEHFLGSKAHLEAHDHWLSYAANEMCAAEGDERYFSFGLNNCMQHLDFILRRETAYPTLLELMMAAQNMLQRVRASGPSRLPATADMDMFRQALHYRAHYLLNGYFWPEMAMFYKNPDRIAGTFFIRHQAFRTRIDDAQHFLSGLAAYGTMLENGDSFWAAPENARSLGSRFAPHVCNE